MHVYNSDFITQGSKLKRILMNYFDFTENILKTMYRNTVKNFRNTLLLNRDTLSVNVKIFQKFAPAVLYEYSIY